jgi:hypothetical protein
MSSRRTRSEEHRQRPRLRKSHEEARQLLEVQIGKGNELAARITPAAYSPSAVDQISAEKRRWSSFNDELLRSIFDTDEVADNYSWFVPIAIGTIYKDPRQDFIDMRESIEESVNRLQAELDKLELYELAPEAAQPQSSMTKRRQVTPPGTVINIQTNLAPLTIGHVLGTIHSHAVTIGGSPAADAFRMAIEEFSGLIAKDASLADEQRKEALENLELVAQTAKLPLAQRVMGPVKATVAAIPGVLASSDHLLAAWQQYGPAIKTYLGL